MPITTKKEAFDLLADCVKWTGRAQVVCRPLRENVPEQPDGAELTICSVCGTECWKLAMEPDRLPKHVIATCTRCALRAGRDAQDEKRKQEGTN